MSETKMLTDEKTNEIIKSTGMHIGLKKCTTDMLQFTLPELENEFYIFDINQTLNKIDVAGRMIATFDPSSVLLYGAEMNHANAIMKFSEITGVRGYTGKLVAGTMTNPKLPDYTDVELLIVSDPQNRIPTRPNRDIRYDARAVQEAQSIGIPIIGICNTDCNTSFIDVVIPANNKGTRAIASVFYLLSRSVLVAKGQVKPNQPLPYQITDFETVVEDLS